MKHYTNRDIEQVSRIIAALDRELMKFGAEFTGNVTIAPAGHATRLEVTVTFQVKPISRTECSSQSAGQEEAKQ
jgi:hypothetical protein